MPNYMHQAKGTLVSGAFWSFGMNSSASISEAAAQTAWDSAVQGFYATAGVAALMDEGFTLTGTSTSTASTTWRQTTITRNTHTTHGTATTQELPDRAAMVVTMRTAYADKSGHGRMYLPAPVSAALADGSGGHLSASSITTLTGALATFRTALTGAGLQPLVLTKKATKSGLPAFNTRLVVEWELVSTLGGQRRRGDKIIPGRTQF